MHEHAEVFLSHELPEYRIFRIAGNTSEPTPVRNIYPEKGLIILRHEVLLLADMLVMDGQFRFRRFLRKIDRIFHRPTHHVIGLPRIEIRVDRHKEIVRPLPVETPRPSRGNRFRLEIFVREPQLDILLIQVVEHHLEQPEQVLRRQFPNLGENLVSKKPHDGFPVSALDSLFEESLLHLILEVDDGVLFIVFPRKSRNLHRSRHRKERREHIRRDRDDAIEFLLPSPHIVESHGLLRVRREVGLPVRIAEFPRGDLQRFRHGVRWRDGIRDPSIEIS